MCNKTAITMRTVMIAGQLNAGVTYILMQPQHSEHHEDARHDDLTGIRAVRKHKLKHHAQDEGHEEK